MQRHVKNIIPGGNGIACFNRVDNYKRINTPPKTQYAALSSPIDAVIVMALFIPLNTFNEESKR